MIVSLVAWVCCETVRVRSDHERELSEIDGGLFDLCWMYVWFL